MRLETNGELLTGALCLIGRESGLLDYDVCVVYHPNNARGLRADFILWLREPTEEEYQVISACFEEN